MFLAWDGPWQKAAVHCSRRLIHCNQLTAAAMKPAGHCSRPIIHCNHRTRTFAARLRGPAGSQLQGSDLLKLRRQPTELAMVVGRVVASDMSSTKQARFSGLCRCCTQQQT